MSQREQHHARLLRRELSPPPPQMEGVLTEIFLRLPPEEPACLFRVSVVCKTWRRVVSDANFPRRYREHHRAPPVLAYLHNKDHDNSSPTRRLIPTTAASPFSSSATPVSPGGWALDARHGRVLLQSYGRGACFIVWDPITDEQLGVPFPEHPLHCNAGAVLCAARGCDHLDCHGGPFLVVAVGHDDDDDAVALGAMYSSETGAWSAPTSVQIDTHDGDFIDMRPSLLAGDAVYFMCFAGMRILRYNMGSHELSAFEPPLDPTVGRCQGVLMTKEGGALGFAGVDGTTIYMWSRQVSPPGVAEWVRRMAMGLDTLFPAGCGTRADLVAFAEGTDTVYVDMDEGVFAVELKSGRISRVGEDAGGCQAIVVYTSFYTPDYGKGRLAPPVRISSPGADLVEDLIVEILLRFPAANPARLVRLYVVCKSWRRLLTDPDFRTRFRARQRRRPLIVGVFSNVPHGESVQVTFMSASDFSLPPLGRDHRSWRILDCRHGLVVLYAKGVNLLRFERDNWGTGSSPAP